jgi:amino acid adenylation domain-containing protein
MLLERFLHETAQRFPDKAALVCGSRRSSYGEIERHSNALAHALRALGLQRQQRVAIHHDNSIETVEAIFATLKASGVFVTVNPQAKPDKLAFLLNDCGVQVLLIGARALAAAARELAGCEQLRHVIALDQEADTDTTAVLRAAGKQLHWLEPLRAAYPTTLPSNRNISLDLASLIYTSGTTGRPKGVMLTHANMHAVSGSICSYLQSQASDVILSALPLAFGYGLYQVLTAFRTGATVVLEKQFLYPYQFIEQLKKEGATTLPLVPTISALLLNLKDLDARDFESVRCITNAAQAMPASHVRRWRELLPRARFYSMYGQTECARVSYLPPELVDAKPTSVGVAIPDTEAWIENEHGEVVTAPDQPGELIVRGPHVMLGYWNRAEETARALRPGRHPGERELRTGDLFRLDADGHLHFVARRDELIKTAGERVGPREVESALYEMQAVKEAAVIGVPDDVLGSAIKAFVALHEGASLTQAEVIKHCQRRLEKFMVPKHVAFVAELPKTPSGKISKIGLA